jgi:putative flippase GtrA
MNKELLRTIKFTLFSLSAGIIEISLYELLSRFTSMPYWPCYLIALVASVVWNFTLNRNFTFKSATNIPIAMCKVFIYYSIFTPISTVWGNYLVEMLHWNGTLVTILNMLLNFVTEYLYDRFFVFRNSIDTKEEKKK